MRGTICKPGDLISTFNSVAFNAERSTLKHDILGFQFQPFRRSLRNMSCDLFGQIYLLRFLFTRKTTHQEINAAVGGRSTALHMKMRNLSRNFRFRYETPNGSFPREEKLPQSPEDHQSCQSPSLRASFKTRLTGSAPVVDVPNNPSPSSSFLNTQGFKMLPALQWLGIRTAFHPRKIDSQQRCLLRDRRSQLIHKEFSRQTSIRNRVYGQFLSKFAEPSRV